MRVESYHLFTQALQERFVRGPSRMDVWLTGNLQTSSALMTFMLAMVENPRVWKRAQAVIDAIVGTDRVPEFDDRPSLPYVDAIVRETLRWRPVTPLGAC